MKARSIIVLLLLGCRAATGATPAFDPSTAIDRCNVVWDSPSENAQGSMPLGNGDVGINAWAEPSGDLVFYVSKTDAWDENGGALQDWPGAGEVRSAPGAEGRLPAGAETPRRRHPDRIRKSAINRPESSCGWTPTSRWSAWRRNRPARQLPGGSGIVALRECPWSPMDDYGYGGGKDSKLEAYRK